MKTKFILPAILAFLFCNSAIAQSTAALYTPTGQCLVADEKANPPANEISVSALSAATQLKVMKEGKLVPDESYPVKSFKMTFQSKAGNISLDSEGENLTPAMYGEMKKLKAGDKVFVEYIKVSSPDGTTRSFNSLVYKIQ